MFKKRAKKNVAEAKSPGALAIERKARTRRFWRYGSVLLLAGLVALGWVSVLTFSPGDPPSLTRWPPKAPVDNAAGLVGAYVAYYLLYWLGNGAYVAMLVGSVAAGAMVMGRRVRDLPWRVLGLALLVVTTSGAFYLLDPTSATDVYRGPAGVLGVGVGQFLRTTFSGAAWIFLAVGFCVGLMYLADNTVLRVLRLGKQAWTKRRRPTTIAATGVARATSPQPAAAVRTGMSALKRTVEAAKAFAKKRPTAPVKPPVMGGMPLPMLTPAEPPRLPAPASRLAGGGRKYDLPSPSLLAVPVGNYKKAQEATADQRQQVLQQLLKDFNVAAEVVGRMTGPVITMYELSLSPGVKVSQVASLATDIARALAVPGVRIVPPRFGKDTVGIEVPNLQKEIVRMRELMERRPESESRMHLPLYLGKDAAGDAIVTDLASMPHILIAGTTGSGKSVCINSILMSMLMTRTPEEVRLILVDPKMVEMAAFEGIPHLLCPIVNDMRKAEDILEWAATKMDERYEMLKEAGVRNLAGYNRLGKEELYRRLGVTSEAEKAAVPLRVPHYVIVIDELADLMMTSSKEVENYVIRIAQKARAVGIHLVLATQRPSVNVVTGLIKSNMPCRVSFRVASRQESRIVLDQNGAEVLLGQGDMLFLQPGTSHLIRAQGAFVDDAEIKPVVKHLRRSGEPEYNTTLIRLQSQPTDGAGGEKDELFDKAAEVVLASQRGSVSLIQRRLQIGYSRASRIIDQMAEAGLLGDYKGSQARECLVTLEEWQHLKKSIAADQSGAAALNGAATIA